MSPHPERIQPRRPLATALRAAASRCTRRFGFELTRYPTPTSYEWHLRTLLDYEEINCVIDVGANRGQSASLLRQLGYQGFIVSFEPVPEAYRELRQKFENDARWRGFELALAARDGVKAFHVAHGDAQASSFLPFNERGPRRWGHDHTVRETMDLETRRLDGLWDACTEGIETPRVLLKMDCQGFDLEVFEGAKGKLGHIVAIQSELALEQFYDGMTHFSDAVRKYEDEGFDAVGFFPLARKAPDYLRVVELDCLFMRRIEDSPETL